MLYVMKTAYLFLVLWNTLKELVFTLVIVSQYIHHRRSSSEIKQVICDYTQRLAKALHVIGLINIQFIVYEDEVYVIEVNPRSSRTIPYISKVTDIPVVDVATKVIMGHSIRIRGYEYGLQQKKKLLQLRCQSSHLKRSRVLKFTWP